MQQYKGEVALMKFGMRKVNFHYSSDAINTNKSFSNQAAQWLHLIILNIMPNLREGFFLSLLNSVRKEFQITVAGFPSPCFDTHFEVSHEKQVMEMPNFE